ncbi:hypothetical protein GCM10022226_50380 [Sphaerisporangium flaviroseum]|uniref:Uncharacterized protein n=1 Tax=Sphaerisporangium flaviroseum TaxID=509199 RepID=A0ABP7IQA1_9ACTN
MFPQFEGKQSPWGLVGVYLPAGGQGLTYCPKPTEEQKRAPRGTAAMASKTVADSVETDRQQEQALHLIERWGPDREGLEQAVISLGVDP